MENLLSKIGLILIIRIGLIGFIVAFILTLLHLPMEAMMVLLFTAYGCGIVAIIFAILISIPWKR